VYSQDPETSIKLIKPKDLEEASILDIDGDTGWGDNVMYYHLYPLTSLAVLENLWLQHVRQNLVMIIIAVSCHIPCAIQYS